MNNSAMSTVELDVNGKRKAVVVRHADTLLDVLRVKLGLTGAKPGCGNGDCGACAVLVDDEPMHSCHMLAVEAAGKRVTTIEGLQGTALQQAFVDHWAVQCGYCTSGMIVASHGLLLRHPNPDEATVNEWLSSNLCRCTGYEEIKQAVLSVARSVGQAGGTTP
ncbi:MAG: (2Fe-2S)-binding protein [Paenibacillaceae bacterium]|jgi:carbon-monoxide dehydrogenase small subunit|nr:(2Fe-2S)-binding protein [Paenibacillaceae bacterium]